MFFRNLCVFSVLFSAMRLPDEPMGAATPGSLIAVNGAAALDCITDYSIRD